MKNEKQLLDLLAKMSKLISSTAQEDQSPTQRSDGSRQSKTDAAEAEPLNCVSIPQLPERLQAKAAETAVRINPVNAPSLAFASALLKTGTDVASPQFLTLLTSKYWGPSPRVLTVSFTEPTPADLRARILSHMNAWTKTGCISFKETNGVGQVRISRGAGGYWSYLGTDILLIPPSKPTMNLQNFSMNTPESEYRRVVRHETGHTLGFPHEHMRQEIVSLIDPQKAYAYFWAHYGWNKAMVDAQVLTPLDPAKIKGTLADKISIMCYQLPAEIMKNGQPIPGGLDIDATDYAFVARIYPKPGHQAAQPHEHQAAEDWTESEDVADEAITAADKASLAAYPAMEDEEIDLYSSPNGVGSAV